MSTSNAAEASAAAAGAPHKVLVTVDGIAHEVVPREYVVSVFKKEVKIEAAKELEQVINGTFTPLSDSQTMRVHGGETFISHARRGGSS